jgi:autotransporter-associated beta strand protein/T5SS/PEP-CTERM-associated repeat protein
VWVGALAMLAPDTAHAVDGTWTGPGAEWTTGTNWSSAPTVPDNTATFTNNVAPTSVTISNDASINAIQFDAAAPAYSFTINSGVTFNINGTGIANSSSFTPSFTNNGTLTFNTPAATTASGATDISGTGRLTKTGAGTLVLSGTNTYSGPTAVNAGTLIAASNSALPDQTAVTVNLGAALAIADGLGPQIGSLADGPSGGGTVVIGFSDPNTTLLIAGNASTTFSGMFAGVGSLELDNGAALTLTGASFGGNIGSIGDLSLCNCDSGGLTISGGALTVSDPSGGTLVQGGTLAVINGGTLQTTNLAVASNMIISGPGSTVSTSPTGLFTEITSFGGPVSVTIADGGVLNTPSGAAIDAATPFGTPTVTVTGPGSTWNVGTALAVGGGGSFGGPGILMISNGGVVNSTGFTTIGDPTGTSAVTVTGTGSVLNAGSSLIIGDSSCGCGAIGTLTIADGGLVNSPGSTSIAAGSTLNLGTGGLAGAIVTPAIVNDGQIVANFTDTVALAADISGAGTLSKAGVGTLILTGNNSYAGGTTTTGGFINFNSANSFGTGPITIDGGGLQWATGNTADISAQLAAFGAGGATFDTNGNNVTLASALSGPGGLTKVGAGTMILSGINTYQGGTTINGGTLAVAADANLGAAAGGLAFGGGTLQFLAGFTTNRTVTLNAGGGTFDTNGNNATLGGTIGGAGALTKIGAGTLTLTGANAYAGGTTINAGTLAVGADANLGAASGGLTFGGGTLQFLAGFTSNRAVTLNAGGGTFDTNGNAATLGGNIGGAGALSKVGTGVLTLTGNNSYSGGSVLNAGTLAVGSNTALGAGTLTFANATTLQAAANGLSLANAMTLNGSDTVDTQSNTLALAGVISGSGALTKIGGGTLTLAGANTYSGGTTLAGGTLTLANNQALGTGALTTTGSVVDYANGVTIGNPIVIDSNTTQLQVTAGTATQAGAISELNGPRPLEKIGAGTLVLTATNTYSGPTTISAGTLVVNGSIANSAVTVNAGALLAGSGIVGATTILSGGMFSPGPVGSPGSITIAGNLAFQSGALYIVQVNPSTASSDIVTAGGSATLAGTVQAAFASGRYASRTYTILSAAGGLNGTMFNALTTSNLPAGFSANLSYSATDVILNLTAQLHAIPGGGLSINQTNVATALDNFFNAGGALPPAFVSVFGLTGANLGNALSALSGEPATGAQQAGFQIGNQFLGLMLDPFVDGRTGVAGAGGPRSASRQSAKRCRMTSRSPIPRCSRRRRRRHRPSSSAGPRGAVPTAAATARRAIRRCWAATISPRALPASPAGSTIAWRPTRSWALRSRAAAPTGASRRGWAAARATRSRPASTARRIGVRPISRWPSPTPTTGCRPTVSPLPATTSPPPSTRSRWADASRAATASACCSAASRPMPRSRHKTSARRPTARPTPTAAALRSPTPRAPRPIPAANWARASIACLRSIPPPRSRCARGSPGRTTG